MEAILAIRAAKDREATTAHAPSAWSDPEPWRELFREVAAGRRDALARIYDLASDRMFGLALWRAGNRDDAAEIVQDAFVRLAERRERLASVEDPRWWLLRLTHRIAVDATRRRRLRRGEPLDDPCYLQAPATDPGREVDAKRASALLARLSPKQREVVYLHHYAGMSHAEIGRALGVPTFTAASRYRLGLATLRRLLGNTP
jgi:RNA polymerase sigma-70 factor (ECF subfamily)